MRIPIRWAWMVLCCVTWIPAHATNPSPWSQRLKAAGHDARRLLVEADPIPCAPTGIIPERTLNGPFPLRASDMRLEKPAKSTGPALIVGNDAPDETLTLTQDTTVTGDIVIMQQGTLVVDGVTLRLDGNIIVVDSGTFDMVGGTLAFQSVYRYQHGFSVSGSGTVRLSNASVTSNGHNLNAGFSESSRFELTDTTFASGITTALFQDASADVNGSNPLEWVLQDNGSLRIAHNNGPFIFWPIFPDGSTADISFPDGNHVDDFSLSDADPNVNGLGVSISLTDVGQVWWGLMLRSGADVTVRDSTMRTTGIIVDEGGDETITGLVNGQSYTDQTFSLAGSTYRLINSSVETWNVYAWGADTLSMDNCLFGELGVLDVTDTTLTHCLIDGTGGYLFTDSETQTSLITSTLLSDTIANGQSLQLFVYSAIVNGDVIATDESIIFLVNTTTDRTPMARDSGLVVDLNVSPPGTVAAGDWVPIHGNACFSAGPDFPLTLDHWQLSVAPGDGSGGDWTPIGGPRTDSVRLATLGLWNTSGLAPGAYTLRLSMTLAGGFTLDTTRPVTIADVPVIAGQAVLPHIASSLLWQSHLTADNPTGTDAKLTVYRYDNGTLIGTTEHAIAAGIQQRIPLPDGTCGFVVSSDPGLVLKETFLHSTEQGMAEFPLTADAGTTRYFLLPHYLADQLTWMGLALMNPGDTEATVTLTAMGPDGTPIQTVQQKLTAVSRFAAVLSSMFPGLDFRTVARIRAESDRAVSGITISGTGNERLLFTAAAPAPLAGTRILPHMAGNWDDWDNVLVLDNVSEAPVTVTLTLFSAGSAVATDVITVDAGATTSVDLSAWRSLAPQMGLVDVPQNGVAVRMSYRNRIGGGVAEFLLSGEAGPSLAFVLPGAFAEAMNWMGLAVANPQDQAAHLTLTGWKNGVPVASEDRELGPHSRLVDVLSGLFAGVSDTGLDRVTVTSDLPLAGLNISGWNQERLLFMPAVVLPE